MKRISCCIVSAVAVLFLGNATAQIESVVKVSDGWGWGSGFVVAEHSDRDDRTYWGLVATARHCVVDGGGGLKVTTCTFQDGFVSDNCRVACYDRDDDCALIWCIVPDAVRPLRIRQGLFPNELIRNFGLSTGPEPDEGIVLICDEHNCYMAVVVVAGDSGGPILDKQGAVVGLITHRQWPVIESDWTARGCAAEPIANLVAIGMVLKLPSRPVLVEGC